MSLQVKKQSIEDNEPLDFKKLDEIQDDSQYLPAYLQYFNEKDLESYRKQQKQFKFLKSQFKIKIIPFRQQFQLKIIRNSENYQLLDISIQYGCFFIQEINILNIKRMFPLKKQQRNQFGNYGSIYRIKYKQTYFASKILYFQQQQPKSSVILDAIKEYTSIIIANFLGAGPGIKKYYGFDILVYDDCVVFSCQYCVNTLDEYINENLQTFQNQLIKNLKIMHSYNFIHMDIKPENICFSRMLNKFVFIDFGFSKIVKEPLGQKILTNFKGTLQYAGIQLKNLFQSKQIYKMIDLYYNDLESLKKSLAQFRLTNLRKESMMDDFNHFGQMRNKYHIKYEDLTGQLYLNEIKFWIYKLKHEKVIDFFLEKEFKKHIKIIQFQDILKFISSMNSNSLMQSIKKIFEEYYQDFDKDFNFNSMNFNIIKIPEIQQDQQQNSLLWTSLQITHKKQQNNTLSQTYLFTHTQMIKKILKTKEYLQLLSIILSISSPKYKIQKKYQFSQTALKYIDEMTKDTQFGKIVTQINKFIEKSPFYSSESLQMIQNGKPKIKNLSEKTSKYDCLCKISRFIFNYAIFESFTPEKYEILLSSLNNIILLNIIKDQQIFELYKMIQNSTLDFILKLKLLFAIKTLLSLRKFKTNLSSQYLYDLFFSIYQLDLQYHLKILSDNTTSTKQKQIHQIFTSKLFNLQNEEEPYQKYIIFKQKLLHLLKQSSKQCKQILMDLKSFLFCHQMYHFCDKLKRQEYYQFMDYVSMKTRKKDSKFEYYHLFIIKYYCDKKYYKNCLSLIQWIESIYGKQQLLSDFSFEIIKSRFNGKDERQYLQRGQIHRQQQLLLQYKAFSNKFCYLSNFIQQIIKISFINLFQNIRLQKVKSKRIYKINFLQLQEHFDIRFIKSQLKFNYQCIYIMLLENLIYKLTKEQFDQQYKSLMKIYERQQKFVYTIISKKLKQQCLRILLLHLQLLLNFKSSQHQTTIIYHQFNRFQYRLYQLKDYDNQSSLPTFFDHFQLFYWQSLLEKKYATNLSVLIASKNKQNRLTMSTIRNDIFLKLQIQFFMKYPKKIVEFLNNSFDKIQDKLSNDIFFLDYFFARLIASNILTDTILKQNYFNFVTNPYQQIKNPYLSLYLINIMHFPCTYNDKRLTIAFLKLMNRIDSKTIRIIEKYYYRAIIQRLKYIMPERFMKKIFYKHFQSFVLFNYPLKFFTKRLVKINMLSQFWKRSQTIKSIRCSMQTKVANYYSNIGYSDHLASISTKNTQKSSNAGIIIYPKIIIKN